MLALEDVDQLQLEVDAALGGKQQHGPARGGRGVVVELHSLLLVD
jgi:hypothetical protein